MKGISFLSLFAHASFATLMIPVPEELQKCLRSGDGCAKIASTEMEVTPDEVFVVHFGDSGSTCSSDPIVNAILFITLAVSIPDLSLKLVPGSVSCDGPFRHKSQGALGLLPSSTSTPSRYEFDLTSLFSCQASSNSTFKSFKQSCGAIDRVIIIADQAFPVDTAPLRPEFMSGCSPGALETLCLTASSPLTSSTTTFTTTSASTPTASSTSEAVPPSASPTATVATTAPAQAEATGVISTDNMTPSPSAPATTAIGKDNGSLGSTVDNCSGIMCRATLIIVVIALCAAALLAVIGYCCCQRRHRLVATEKPDRAIVAPNQTAVPMRAATMPEPAANYSVLQRRSQANYPGATYDALNRTDQPPQQYSVLQSPQPRSTPSEAYDRLSHGPGQGAYMVMNPAYNDSPSRRTSSVSA